MPLLHCSNCHHEYESYDKDWKKDLCDWCGYTPILLDEKTDVEKTDWTSVLEMLKKNIAIEKEKIKCLKI